MSLEMYHLHQYDNKNKVPLPWINGAPKIVLASLLLAAPIHLHAQISSNFLPNAPSALMVQVTSATQSNDLAANDAAKSQDAPQGSAQSATQNPQPSAVATITPLRPCPKSRDKHHVPIIFLPSTQPSCDDPIQSIVDTGHVSPLTSRQKGILATREVTDPFNLLTIGFFSAITIAANSHTAYGPGFKGWGKLSGYSFAEDIQSEFTGTFLIPSLAREDPRYHRMPGAPVSRRIKHALIHTVISQHDNGEWMPNYATLINYPLSAEISNLYVPNVGTNGPSTARRILLGYATDPIGPLVAEFLPDFAKRVHIHVIFSQQILNRMAPGAGEGPGF
jgi:hypothetical protein